MEGRRSEAHNGGSRWSLKCRKEEWDEVVRHTHVLLEISHSGPHGTGVSFLSVGMLGTIGLCESRRSIALPWDPADVRIADLSGHAGHAGQP